MTTVAVYDADKVANITLEDKPVQALAFSTPEFVAQAGIVWTNKVRDGGDEPSTLTINTMAARYTYLNPRLIYCGNRIVILSGLSDHAESGTLTGVKKYYIRLELTCD